jgi:DNA-binding NarL/FixJ family response regulator
VTPISVLIADDHAPTRADVRVALEEHPEFRVCAEVSDAAAAVNAAARHRPDVFLVDISMPGGGIAATWEITARLPDTRVVMLTVSRQDDDLFDSLRAGAVGYLLKDTDPARLPLALLDVVRGDTAIPRILVARLVEEFRERGPRRRALLTRQANGRLTSREWEVLELLREGLSTGEIAGKLYISQATVRSHIASILRKLRVPDREAAVRLFASTP